MTDDQCQECGDAGWVWEWETPEVKSLVPCMSCIDAGRGIPPKHGEGIDEELDEVDDYIGWEEV